MVHQINSIKEVLKLKQIFQKNKLATGKNSTLCVIGPFCGRYSICLNIGFWQSSFEWKWCVFNFSGGTPVFWKKFLFSRKFVSKLKYWKRLKLSLIATHKHAYLSNGGLFWKSLASFSRRTYALSIGFKMKILRKSVFEC